MLGSSKYDATPVGSPLSPTMKNGCLRASAEKNLISLKSPLAVAKFREYPTLD